MPTFLERLGFIRPPAIKAASGPGVFAMLNDTPLFTLGNTPQKRMAAYLKAYKVGWFYKAESKIAGDMSTLKVTVAHEDDTGANEAVVVEPDLFTPWERLDPLGQFLRLMERPNPYQTGRQLRFKTQVRIDMAGAAFWYLEGVGTGFTLPTALYGISPARMWPSTDRNGILIGWVMDRDKPGGGVPFEAHEILPFMAGSADDDPWGVGVVEAVYHEQPLTELMARHIGDLLMSGGRLAGMAWPKNRALDEGEFEDAKRAWRSVSSDPNAARRLLLFPEPMEWVAGASTPKDIGIPDLANLNRDNILTAFPISPYQLGVPMPGGLNSAETRREDRKDYWEGTIHPRVELLEEVIQVGLLSRYEEVLGTTFDFDIIEPNLDDPVTLVNKLGALDAMFTLGFDEKESVKAVGLDHIKFNGRPVPPASDPGAAGDTGTGLKIQVGDGQRRDNSQITETVKADTHSHGQRIVEEEMARAKPHLVSFFANQRERIAKRLKDTLPSTKAARLLAIKDDPDWWDGNEEDQQLSGALRGLYADVGRAGLQVVADKLGRFVAPHNIKPVLDDLFTYGGSRIADINARTLQSIVTLLAEGTRRGYSVPQLIEGVPAEGFGGVLGVTLDNGLPVFGDARAEMIARTETMLSYNRSSLSGYKEFGVAEVVAYDGDKDYECSVRNGSVYPVDVAYGIADHPNGTLDWGPITKAVDFRDPVVALAEALKVVGTPAPVNVTVHTPEPAKRTIIEKVDGKYLVTEESV